MPRVKRVGHKLREVVDLPLCEWPEDRLTDEVKRLEADPGDLNPWEAFKRKTELTDEVERRFFAGNLEDPDAPRPRLMVAK